MRRPISSTGTLFFSKSRDGALSTIDSILDRLKQSVMRLGVWGVSLILTT